MSYTYQITQFDGVVMPAYNPASNMGTGLALSSFLQLPGRGFFDNYGTATAPQGLRPIDYDCTIYGATPAARRTTIDALRAKLGKRGKLTVTFADGSLRWQWARLIEVDVADENRWAESVDCRLRWITAAQHWYGIINTGAGWTWGDGSWVWGDGTVEFGESGTSETLTATGGGGGTTQLITLSNDGNTPATNVVFTVTAGTSTITAITVANAESGYSWTYTGTIATATALVVNCGSMAVTNAGADAYSAFTPSDVDTWEAMVAGENNYTVTVTGNATVDGTIAIEYYDHWA